MRLEVCPHYLEKNPTNKIKQPALSQAPCSAPRNQYSPAGRPTNLLFGGVGILRFTESVVPNNVTFDHELFHTYSMTVVLLQ